MCSAHSIDETVVIDTVLTTLNTIINNMIDVENAMKRKNRHIVEKAMHRLQNQIDTVNIEFVKFTKAKGCLYADYVNGDISKSDYQFMKKDFEDKCTVLENRIVKLTQEQKDYQSNNLFNNQAVNTYTKYKGIELLNRKIAVALIDRIIVDNENGIKIVFKFRDEVKKYQYENL